MQIDPRLDAIDDCLYRVATKAIIVQDKRVLLVKETPETYWGFPGGGIDHGETVESSLCREVEEELGVPAAQVSSDFAIAHYNIGTVVDGIPRMNLFYRVTVAEGHLKKTKEVLGWQWFDKEEFARLYMSPSYSNRTELAAVIFRDS